MVTSVIWYRLPTNFLLESILGQRFNFNAMYVQVLEQENRVAEAKSNGLGIRVTCLFYLSSTFPKNIQYVV
jgi:hypothetical protein